MSGRDSKYSPPNTAPQELAIGPTLFRVMRAVMFAETPLPELDALPMAQLRLLWTVFHGSEATMKDFSERLGVSQSTVTQLADRLVKRGLVERHSDPSDRRIVRLQVSTLGRALLSQTNRQQQETLDAVWAALSPAEQGSVMRGLEILAHAAEEVRVAEGRPLPPMPEWRSSEHTTEEYGETVSRQPVVDLMARRVRGKSV